MYNKKGQKGEIMYTVKSMQHDRYFVRPKVNEIEGQQNNTRDTKQTIHYIIVPSITQLKNKLFQQPNNSDNTPRQLQTWNIACLASPKKIKEKIQPNKRLQS